MLIAVGCAALLVVIGCGSDGRGSSRGRAIASDAGSSSAGPPGTPATPGSSPTGRPYQVPAAADLCAAVRTAGVPTRELEVRTPNPDRQDCKVEVGAGDKQRYTLRLKFEDKLSVEKARVWFEDLREDYTSRGYSAFTGVPKNTGELRQIGALKASSGFDNGFYAYYAPVEVAGIKYGQSIIVLQLGNILMIFDLLGGDAVGSGVAGIRPVPESVGQELFDKVADETVGLIRPKTS
ncbi:hypothetical protein [Virgisporangium aurantiacum]|uniref:hypothetical protein n=1 Tax=Virgisporangium aurantiacum TaxID=175570 RepID=UPI00194EA57B|nr:hypothetical protein [Virgisporangium aurantiacum]